MSRKRKILIFIAILLVSLAVFGGVKYLNLTKEHSLSYASKVLVGTEPRDIKGFTPDETAIQIYSDGSKYGNIYLNRSIYKKEIININDNFDTKNSTKVTEYKYTLIDYEVVKMAYGLIIETNGLIQRTKGADEVIRYE